MLFGQIIKKTSAVIIQLVYLHFNQISIQFFNSKPTHCKGPGAGKHWRQRRRDSRGWDGWMASQTQWTWTEQTLGDSGGLACCIPWGRKESDMTWRWKNNTLLQQMTTDRHKHHKLYRVSWPWVLTIFSNKNIFFSNKYRGVKVAYTAIWGDCIAEEPVNPNTYCVMEILAKMGLAGHGRPFKFLNELTFADEK